MNDEIGLVQGVQSGLLYGTSINDINSIASLEILLVRGSKIAKTGDTRDLDSVSKRPGFFPLWSR